MKHPLLEFDRRPSAAAFMLKAFYPSPGLRASEGFPPIAARWRGHRVDRNELRDFSALTGLHADGSLPILYPHAFGFRLPMVILTHPAFPLPIWSVLQIRNRLLQHQPISPTATMDLETRVTGHRILEKGAEVDLHTTVTADGARAWESLNTFYYRGRFGEPTQASPGREAPPKPATVISRWRLPSRVGWQFARMTGDYNGVHRWNWYARLFGFRKAFFHSQMIAGQCLARLPSPGRDRPQRLDLWLKGPVYFGSEVTLYADVREAATEFAAVPDGDERPALLGCWAVTRPQDRLPDALSSD
ncbi:MAG: acyl dehydratase [Bradyrhizobiaceae bacterium]|nr:acyl dehydratase [Bradyrhizobiaceae bacterium]